MENKNSLLLEAAEEITSLRNKNSLMTARLDMFDQLMQLFHTQPRYADRGMGEDVVWKIKQLIEAENKLPK